MDINNSWIERDGLRFLVLKDSNIDQLGLLNDADAVIIIHSNDRLTECMLENIRIGEEESVFLKPTFVCADTSKLPAAYRNIVDGQINNIEAALPELVNTVSKIKEVLDKLVPVQALNFESHTINKLLRFYYTRDNKYIEPLLDRKAKIGYSYPLISQYFTNQDDKNILDILAVAEEEGYLVGEHHESLYLCNHCYNGFLFYREVCPKCASSNLKQEDLVHHFPCAYIGPISDFTSEVSKNEMACPKCNKQLRHIGVDYDKPSIVYTCHSCNHIFQDVQIKAKCCECERDTEVEHLLNRNIKKYTITSKGLYAAQNGIMSTQKDLAAISGTVSMDTFTIMLRYEIERMKIAEIESNLGYIHINNVMDLYLQVGLDSKHSLLVELVRIIRSGIRNSDVIAFESTTTLLFSLTEINSEDAKMTVRKICIMIRRLMRDNFNGFQADIEYRVLPIKKHVSFAEQLNDVTNKMHSTKS